MPWARIDDNMLSHQKFEKIPDRELGFWLRGLVYAARNLTDGSIPRRFVRNKTQLGLASALVSRGLWERTATGWTIHDFLQYHPPKAEIERLRRLTRERQAKWREKHNAGVTHLPEARNAGPVLALPVLKDKEGLDLDLATRNGEQPTPEEVTRAKTQVQTFIQKLGAKFSVPSWGKTP